MTFRIVLLWIIGGIIIIPYAVYHLVFTAQRDEYAFLIVIPLFWIFGFWGVVAPLIAAYKVHRLMKSLDQATSQAALHAAYERNDGREIIIDLIAKDNKIPRFIARRLYDRVATKLAAHNPSVSAADGSQ